MYIWGYSLFALTAASLCSPYNPVALRVRSRSSHSWLDSNLTQLASLTYAAYVFHGPALAALESVAPWIKAHGLGPVGPIVFSLAVAGSFSLAQVARFAADRIATVPSAMTSFRRVSPTD
jgi:hypothetical protein